MTNIMHFTLLTQYYPPEIGAAPTRLSELAVRFIQRGHSVSVLTAMPNYPAGRIYPGYGGLFRTDHQNGIDIYRTFIYPTQKASLLPRLTNYFSFVLSSAVLGAASLSRSDYVLVESPPLFLGLSGIWLSRLKRSRLIFNVSDLWPESAVRLGVLKSGSLAHRISERIEALGYRQAWLVTGQSKSILSDIATRFPGSRTFHLSNGVDTQLFHPRRETAVARATLNQQGECVALYAGLHGLAQGLDQILRAAEVLRADSKVQFTLIGEGPEKRTLIGQARGRNLTNVRFLDRFRPGRFRLWWLPRILC